MTTEVTFRTGPGVRLRVARRGPRRPIGPAVSRVDARGRAPDPAGVAFAAAADGGRVTAAGVDEQGPRDDGFTDIASHLAALTGLHRCRLERAERPVVAQLARDRRGSERELGRAATAGIPPWRLVSRWAARQEAIQAGAGELDPRRRLPGGRAGSQEAADAWWQRLLANEPAAVTAALARAFADHAFGAAVAATGSTSADLVLSSEPVDVLVGRWQPREGDAALVRMTRPRRHELHAAVLGSAVIALAAEALAVAPALTEVRVAVVQPDYPDGQPGVLLVAQLPRSAVLPDGASVPAVDDLAAEAVAGRVGVAVAAHGSAGALVSLDRSTPDIARLLGVLTIT